MILLQLTYFFNFFKCFFFFLFQTVDLIGKRTSSFWVLMKLSKEDWRSSISTNDCTMSEMWSVWSCSWRILKTCSYSCT